MIEHLVLFETKQGTPEETRRQMVQQLLALKHDIPEIVQISAGENFSSRGMGFDLGLVVRFHSREDLAIYSEHPKHTVVVESLIRPNVERVVACDYEFAEA